VSGAGADDQQDDGRVALADRSHRYSGVPVSDLFTALTTGRDLWLLLQPGEVKPEVLEAVPDQRVVWSSFWPSSPGDTIEFELRPHGNGSELRFLWRTSSPPDERSVAITRQRLNKKLGGEIRGAFAWWPPDLS
jgi:hypothetical protein